MANTTVARAHNGKPSKRSFLSLFKKDEPVQVAVTEKPIPSLGRTIILDTVRTLGYVRSDIVNEGWDFAEGTVESFTARRQAILITVISMFAPDIPVSKNPHTKQQKLIADVLRELTVINKRWETSGWAAAEDLAGTWTTAKRVTVIMIASLFTQNWQKKYGNL